MIIQPYDDEDMIFNKPTNKYILTPKALQNIGITTYTDLASSTPEQIALQRTLNKISTKIYSYVHNQNGNNTLQDYLIAHVDTLRPIIKEAMLIQAERLFSLGDLSLSFEHADKDISKDAIDVLNTNLNELMGQSILYRGRWEPWVCLMF